jgi:hypothetical protein
MLVLGTGRGFGRGGPCDARYPKDRDETRAMNGAVDAPIEYAFCHCFAAVAGDAVAMEGTAAKLKEAM